MRHSSAGGTLGAILAGGASRRFGARKALERLAGAPLIDHARRALAAAVPELVVITADAEVARATGLRHRPDRVSGGGALAGLHAALHWADDLGYAGVLAVACDTPFLPSELLAAIAAAAEADAPDALAPEGPSGPEPLCAWYSVRVLPQVEARIAQGERSLRGLLAGVGAAAIPLTAVRAYGPPGILFMNVNTPEDLARAERLLLHPSEWHVPI